jgi:hypothetical protein
MKIVYKFFDFELQKVSFFYNLIGSKKTRFILKINQNDIKKKIVQNISPDIITGEKNDRIKYFGNLTNNTFILQSRYVLGSFGKEFNYCIKGMILNDKNSGTIIKYKTLLSFYPFKYFAGLTMCFIPFLFGILGGSYFPLLISLILYILFDFFFNLILIQNSTKAKSSFEEFIKY